jgi:ABC-type glutathione transport system ATPase component
MITVKNIRLNNSRNKTYLTFDDAISFHDNIIYFIIGKSGIGKTSLIDFITGPFTDDPIKNGEIILSDDIALKSPFTKKLIDTIAVKNSHSFWSRPYVNFMRKSVALIPQKTDSFHPTIPIRGQIERFYKMALPAGAKPEKTFDEILEELSQCAGWNNVSVDLKDKRAVVLTDIKEYKEVDTVPECRYPIVNIRNEKKLYEKKLSTGQLQRLLILMGLMQFRASKHPLLIGDEFLVNFTYYEANEVLKNIIDFYRKEEKDHKIAIFILHDLSFDFLKNYPAGYPPVRLIGIEKDLNYKPGMSETRDAKRITIHEMSLIDFFSENWVGNTENERFFREFKRSYDDRALTHEECKIKIKPAEEDYSYDIDIDKARIYKGTYIEEKPLLYKDIRLKIKKNRFIILTGFSGCGKSTLCNQYVSEYWGDKKSFRYFPSRALSSLSESSQISINQDLQIMYNYYNGIKDLDIRSKHRESIESILEKIHFYEDVDKISEGREKRIKEFSRKKIYDLSGGEQQRYWFARLLFDYTENGNFQRPGLIIFDESIASLDCITKNKIIAFLLQEIFSGDGTTVLFVSHDLRDISVIYKTLLANTGTENINKVFEHYEMFAGGLYRVDTDFLSYRENLRDKIPNVYYSVNDSNKTKPLKLRLNTNCTDMVSGGKKNEINRK